MTPDKHLVVDKCHAQIKLTTFCLLCEGISAAERIWKCSTVSYHQSHYPDHRHASGGCSLPTCSYRPSTRSAKLQSLTNRWADRFRIHPGSRIDSNYPSGQVSTTKVMVT